jgi:hypothetical protein
MAKSAVRLHHRKRGSSFSLPFSRSAGIGRRSLPCWTGCDAVPRGFGVFCPIRLLQPPISYSGRETSQRARCTRLPWVNVLKKGNTAVDNAIRLMLFAPSYFVIVIVIAMVQLCVTGPISSALSRHGLLGLEPVVFAQPPFCLAGTITPYIWVGSHTWRMILQEAETFSEGRCSWSNPSCRKSRKGRAGRGCGKFARSTERKKSRG